MLHAIGAWIYWFFGFSGSGSHYGFWSGAGSDVGELAILGAVVGMSRKHNCGVKGCWRLGVRQVHGTEHVVCHRHHPRPRPTAESIAADHANATQQG